MEAWELVFYESANGRSPVVEFLDKLPAAELDRVLSALELLGVYGTSLGMPHVRPVTGTELWELRVRGRVQHRVFYLALRGRRFLLLHAFEKKTQQTHEREIKTAVARLGDFRKRSQP